MYICNYKVHFHAYYRKITIRNVSLSLSTDTHPTHYRREKKTKQKKKKTKVIKAYNSIFFPFFPPACLNFLGGLSVLRWLPGDSRLMASKQIGEEA